MRRIWVWSLLVGLMAVPALVAEEAVTKVVGTIVLDDQPLPRGKITFYLDDDQFVGAKVRDGKFQVKNVPVGEWSIVIEGDGVAPQFTSEERTPLRVTVKKGENMFAFDIKKKSKPG